MSLLSQKDLLSQITKLVEIAAQQENLTGELREYSGLFWGCYFTWTSQDGLVRRLILRLVEQSIIIKLRIWNQTGENQT